MTARPTLVVFAIASAGACLLLLAGPHELPSRYVPAAFGALVAGLVVARLLRDLRPRDRLSIAVGAGFLGFLVGSVSGVGPFPASLAFAGAFLPAFALFVAGIGRERAAFELAELEEAIDDPKARADAIARASALREEAGRAAREMDPEARGEPEHAGDPRAVHAYASQVVAYGRALDAAYEAAIEALDPVPIAWMPRPMRPLMISNLAFFRLCAVAPEAAIDALDRLPEKDAVAEHRAVLRVTRAAALAHLGREEEARALVGSNDDEVLPPERLAHRFAIVRAFLEADPGRAEEAFRAVVVTPEGRAELARFRAAAPSGPAEIIARVLASGSE